MKNVGLVGREALTNVKQQGDINFVTKMIAVSLKYASYEGYKFLSSFCFDRLVTF